MRVFNDTSLIASNQSSFQALSRPELRWGATSPFEHRKDALSFYIGRVEFLVKRHAYGRRQHF